MGMRWAATARLNSSKLMPWASAWLLNSSSMSVSTSPGQMALMLSPLGAFSSAAQRVIPTTACLLVL